MNRETAKQLNKEKVTLTLSPYFLKEVDRWSEEEKIKSRSAAIERLIEEWLIERKKKSLEAETEAYYLSMSQTEREEDQAWVKLSTSQALKRRDS